MEVTNVKYGNQHSVTKTFYEWCVDNNRMDLNDRFDEIKNNCTTKDVGYKSNLKWWFKCPKGIHDSEQYFMCSITKNANRTILCRKCNSLAQVVIDKFGEEYFNAHWCSNNTLDPWEIPASSTKRVLIQCVEKSYHVYEQIAGNFSKGAGCPYCINRLVHPNDSLAALCPDVIKRWSSKNNKTPYEISPCSSENIWLKCPNGKHDDYLQKASNAKLYEYRCPECSLEETSQRMRENGTHFWKGGVCEYNDVLRHRREYKRWRSKVYERDEYTCQCCGEVGGKLNAHHIYQFSDYPELRHNIDNGITMCVKCHDSNYNGSFHNIYGTHNTTPKQLQEYILNKSGVDIFDIHTEFLHSVDYNNTKLLSPEKEVV